MTTPDFNAILTHHEQKSSQLERLLSELQRDVAAIHNSRHQTQENLAIKLGEMQLTDKRCEDNLKELSEIVKTLVQGLQGNGFGASGMVAQVGALEKRTKDLEEVIVQLRGMQRLIVAGAFVITLTVGVKTLFFK